MERTLARSTLLVLAVSTLSAARHDPGLDDSLQKAIRKGDAAQVRTLLDRGAGSNALDDTGTPALMNAALYADTQCMRILLDRGADPNAADAAGATALIWAAGDPAKARLLMTRGADVQARSKAGRTPIMVAAATAGSAETVKMMIDRGADIHARDRLKTPGVVFTGGGGATPLIDASRTGDMATIKMLIAHGADVNARDSHGGTALSEAVVYKRRDLVKFLLERGANAASATEAGKFPVLSLAAMQGDVEILRMLLAKGASLEARDYSGSTPLMWATYHDHAAEPMVRVLVAAGADVKAKNTAGETAVMWAARRGETPAVRVLREEGAEPVEVPLGTSVAEGGSPEPMQVAIQRALEVLARSSEPAFKRTGCISCHNHALPAMALGYAREREIFDDPNASRQLMSMMLSVMKPAGDILLQGTDVIPESAGTGGYLAMALKAQNYAADKCTAALIHNLAGKQNADGRWTGWAPRPPLGNGDIQTTALAIRALTLYAPEGRHAEFQARIVRARQWMLKARPATTEEEIMRLFGLYWAQADRKDIMAATRQLLSSQREDGGWGQLSTLPADAYATGKALVALREAAGIESGYTAFRRGIDYLRRTQEADGSWHVRTRSFPFQPLVGIDFPHGRDQWISAAATSWAVMALTLDRESM